MNYWIILNTYFRTLTFTLAYMVTGCVSISGFASLVCIPIDIASSSVGRKSCAMNPGIIVNN